MARILHFTSGPADWQALLAEPTKHWRTGYSARTLAHCWEAEEDGFPSEVATAMANSADPSLADLEPILAVPEFKVPLPGGERASQNDIFVLARSTSGPVSIMVEGKCNEPFGPTIEEWRADASPGKKTRLSFLLRSVGLPKQIDGAIRYQLLHRAASAVIEGERYRAVAAVLLVHSFSAKRTGWSDYRAFLNLFNVRAEVGRPQRLPGEQIVPLFAVWVPGNLQFLTS
jgi:hypothetical protein